MSELHISRRATLSSLSMLGLAACAAPVVGPTGKPADGNALAEAMAADPRLSTFVSIIQLQGMWRTLRGSTREYTIFAPVNSAFDKLPRGWRSTIVPTNSSVNGGFDNRARVIGLLRMHFVGGSYPPSAFAGQSQNVKTLAGTEFVADGTVPGRITISLRPTIETGIGFPMPEEEPAPINVLMPPIGTAGGWIYPIDAVAIQ
jgi:uncharacterized surface protein with fasciclin (FAS1) repeats